MGGCGFIILLEGGKGKETTKRMSGGKKKGRKRKVGRKRGESRESGGPRLGKETDPPIFLSKKDEEGFLVGGKGEGGRGASSEKISNSQKEKKREMVKKEEGAGGDKLFPVVEKSGKTNARLIQL